MANKNNDFLSQDKIDSLLLNDDTNNTILNNAEDNINSNKFNHKIKKVRFKDIQIVKCNKCNSNDVIKDTIIHPGAGVVFKCKNCKNEYIIRYDDKYDVIEMEEDDYWYYKFLRNYKLTIKISKYEIEKFIECKLRQNEWDNLLVLQNICNQCETESNVPSLFYDENIGLHFFKTHCSNCGNKQEIVLDPLL